MSTLILSTVRKAFGVLELLESAKAGYTLTEISKHLRLSIGGTQRLTNTLIMLQYICKDKDTKAFRLTPKLLSFGFAYLSQLEVQEVALPYIRQLNKDLDQIVNLGIMINDDEIVYIGRIDKTSHERITTNVRVGSKRLFYLSSIGHAILAFLPNRDQSRILNNLYSARHPDGNLPGKNQFMEQLKEIKRLGYSVLKPKLFRDIQSLATPILNHQGLPIAGINIVIPRTIPGGRIKQEFVPKLIEAGKNISLALGHQEGRIG